MEIEEEALYLELSNRCIYYIDVSWYACIIYLLRYTDIHMMNGFEKHPLFRLQLKSIDFLTVIPCMAL